MKASETRIEDFLSTNKAQFVIPVYQRNYDWTTAQCRQLLNDIMEAGRSSESDAHFIGSIVFIHEDVYTSSRMKELVIIDGQQRLTTLTLIYLTLYKLAQKTGNQELESEIYETYLINKFAVESEKLKLKPTENNDRAYQFLLSDHDGDQFSEYSRLIENFKYLSSRINKENHEVILQGLAKLVFVEISLERNKDNPQRIFESLNSTGLELSQADLIRNYILMGLKPDEQNRTYKDYWAVIECYAKNETKNDSLVSEFIRDYLTLKSKKIPNKNKVYTAFKEKFSDLTVDALKDVLADMKRLVIHYNKLANPNKEKDKQIREQLEYISRLEINVTFPFLLQVYDDYACEKIEKPTFIAVLELIQSFTWRRFILSLPSNALNKIFMTLYDKVELENYITSIQKALLQRTGTQRFPRDSEVLDALKVKDVYNIQTRNRMYLLERLENHNNTEKVLIEGNPKITTEHIFPQNPDSRWKESLGEKAYQEIK